MLRTDRLVLSPPSPDDAEAIFAACQDPVLQQYTTVPAPYERHHADDFIAKTQTWWDEGTEVTWAIRADGLLVGMIGVHALRDEEGEIGYWMADAARGQGYLVEAGRAVVDVALDPQGLALVRLGWRAIAGNIASARAARALGFRYEGLLRQGLHGPRGHHDGWIAALLPTDDRMPQPWPVLAD